jgi:hypothetical protein
MRSEEILSPAGPRIGFSRWPGGLFIPALALLGVVAMAGCSGQAQSEPAAGKNAAAAAEPSAAPDAPQVITSLSQISSGSTDTASLNNAAKVLKSRPSSADDRVVVGIGQDTPSVLRRLFIENPESPRYVETVIPHVQVRLLNEKAAEYPGFSNMMLTQLVTELAKQEKMPPIIKLQLSEPVKPVIVTAVLNEDGQLKELIYDQHSGLAVIDEFVISSCKASLWANNIPKEAAQPDGNYRLRLEILISNYTSTQKGEHTFLTRVGIGIL